jgi:hypothetical protein
MSRLYSPVFFGRNLSIVFFGIGFFLPMMAFAGCGVTGADKRSVV